MSLIEALVDEANIDRAWKNVKANRGTPGPDGITITEFPNWFRPRWHSIRQDRIREITGRSRGISMERRLSELRSYVRGCMGYYGLASQLKLFASLEQWIRRRIRCCYWKRWRRVRTRIRELLALGVPRRQAIRHGKSRKGPWHMAKTIASGVGMTNAWLADQGVLSLKTLWSELAHLR